MTAAVVEYAILLQAQQAINAAMDSARAFLKTEKSAQAMGKSFDDAEAGIKALGGSLAKGATNAEVMSSALKSLGGNAASVEKAAASAASQIGVLTAAQERNLAAVRKGAAGGGGMFPSGDGKHNNIGSGLLAGSAGHRLISTGMNFWLGEQLAHMAFSGLNHVMEAASKSVMSLTRLKMEGATEAELQQVKRIAGDNAQKFRTVSYNEAVEFIQEDTQIYGTLEKALEHSQTHVKLVGLLRSLEGGKHAASAASDTHEALAALRSAETANKWDVAELEKHAQALLATKVVFKDQAKWGQYLSAQRAASQYFPFFSDEFMTTIFPTLVQENQSGAGVGLATAGQAIVGSVKLTKKQLGEMQRWGFSDRGGWRQDLRDDFKKNPFLAANKMFDEIAKHSGIDPRTLHKVLPSGDDNPLYSADADARMKHLISDRIATLFPNRKAAASMQLMYLQHDKLMKDAALNKRTVEEVMKAWENAAVFMATTWPGAVEQAQRKWEDFVGALGMPGLNPAIAGLDLLSIGLAGVSRVMREHPELTGGALAGAAGLGTLWATGLLARLGPKTVGNGLLGRVGGLAGKGLGGMLAVSAVLQIADVVIPDHIKAQLQSMLSKMYKDVANWWNDTSEHKQRINEAENGKPGDRQWSDPEFHRTPSQILYDANRRLNRMAGRDPDLPNALWWSPSDGQVQGPPMPRRLMDESTAAAAARLRIEGQVKGEVEVTSKVEMPSSITVNVTGTVNGPISGSANIPTAATAGRGQAAVDGPIQ